MNNICKKCEWCPRYTKSTIYCEWYSQTTTWEIADKRVRNGKCCKTRARNQLLTR